MITKKENQTFKKFSTLTAVLFGGALLAIGTEWLISSSIQPGNMSASVVHASNEEAMVEENPSLNITLEARAVYVLDVTTGKALFAQNENEKLPLASVSKLMTALVARERMPTNTIVTLAKDDLSADGDVGLRPGERWLLSSLIDVMLIVSSNDAANAVASFVGLDGQDVDLPASRARFIQMMNEKAKTLGFSSMEFFNESGLDVSDTRNGGYGSAREVALLMTELWKKYPETLEITARKDARIYSEDKLAHILPNTNDTTGRFPGLLGSKTGYTALAGGNLAIIFDRGIGSPVVAIVLGSTRNERFSDMQKLVQATLKVFE